MADRELTMSEETGVFLQHKTTGIKCTILYKDINGYHLKCETDNTIFFLPFINKNQYRVIE